MTAATYEHRTRAGRQVREREARRRLDDALRRRMALGEGQVIPPPPPPSADPYRSGRLRAALALDADPAEPILARSRYAVSAAHLPEDVRLQAFREEAEARGLSHLLPRPPWERTPEEVERDRIRQEERERQGLTHTRSTQRDWSPEE